MFCIIIFCSGRSEEEAIEKAAAKFGVGKDKISLKQGKDQMFLPTRGFATLRDAMTDLV